MKKFSKFEREEMEHHDKEAKFYALRNEKDYIWEVPAEFYLLKDKYIKPRNTVIDMGCGPSVLIKHILNKKLLNKISYIGIDISKEMLKIAKKNIPNGRFIQSDMEKVALKSESADVIVSLGALHHARNKRKTLENWLSLLKKHGFILLREPTKESLKRGQGESPNEEGISMDEINKSLKGKADLVKVVYFWSPLFHFINKVLIKIGLGFWRESKQIWRIMFLLDVLSINLLNKIVDGYHGDSVVLIIQKK